MTLMPAKFTLNLKVLIITAADDSLIFSCIFQRN